MLECWNDWGSIWYNAGLRDRAGGIYKKGSRGRTKMNSKQGKIDGGLITGNGCLRRHDSLYLCFALSKGACKNESAYRTPPQYLTTSRAPLIRPETDALLAQAHTE
jgi:hypothetical protein